MLDMSLPVRMAGLMNGQELEALRISLKAAAGIKANISVQLPTGKRVQNHYPANLTLWDLLHQVESASEVPITNVTDPKTGKYMMPSLTIMNREFSTLQLLKESTLYGVGASKAPILFRLKFKPSDLTLAEVMEQEEKDKKKESDAAEAAVAAAVTPAESAAPKAEAMIPVKEEDSAMEVEPEKKKAVITESQPKDSMAIEDKSDEKKRMEVSEAEKERIVQEYLKRYQLTDDDLQKFKEEQQAKAQAAQMHNQQAPAPAVAAKEAKEEEEKERYDPYGAATDEDVPESEREVHVYSPSTGKYNPADYDVPDEFFELTAEDLRMLRQNSAKEAEEARMLMTREMRERRARAHCKVFERCRIRVRFPDMVELQRVFLPNAKVGAIFRLVRESLADPTTEFSLFTTPPNRPLGNPEATLARRGLVPATIVHVRFAKPVVVERITVSV